MGILFVGHIAQSATTAIFGTTQGTLNGVLLAVTRGVMHGAAQGIIQGVSGGNAGQSFITAMATSIAGDAFGAIGGKVGDYTHNIVGQSLFGSVIGGVTSRLQGGNFWEGAAIGLTVSLLNHAGNKLYPVIERMLQGPPKNKYQAYFRARLEDTKIKQMPPDLRAKISRLRNGFNFLEEYGGYAELAGLVLAPFTEGASLGVIPVGMAFTAIGTTGNIILDIVEFEYTNDPTKLTFARNRAIKYGLTLGTGYTLSKLTFNFTDKLITKFLDVVIDKGIYSTLLPINK